MSKNRRSKIARLPFAIREEINRRLLENEPARKIYTWLNSLPEVLAVCDEFGEQPIDDRNISDWRLGGFQDWLRRRETVQQTKEMAQWSVQLAKANGGDLSEGAAAILAGQILEVLEGSARIKAEGRMQNAEEIAAVAAAVESLTLALSSIRKGDHNRIKLDQNEKQLAQRDETIALEREKFFTDAARIALKVLKDDQAKQIEAGTGTNEEKIEMMGKHLFGELWSSPPRRKGAEAVK